VGEKGESSPFYRENPTFSATPMAVRPRVRAGPWPGDACPRASARTWGVRVEASARPRHVGAGAGPRPRGRGFYRVRGYMRTRADVRTDIFNQKRSLWHPYLRLKFLSGSQYLSRVSIWQPVINNRLLGIVYLGIRNQKPGMGPNRSDPGYLSPGIGRMGAIG
jgi:hypothetical protein